MSERTSSNPPGASAATVPRLRRMPGIDGLRAVAVTAVFAYHVDPSWLPGGFLGVDVFFVISGYLITSLLLEELSSRGSVSLPRFWMRRARRLLPALFLLLGVCLLVGATVARGSFALQGDALAAIFYVANWRFVFEHVSYFAQFGRPPLLRHLWSLAVEEQFYLVWPVLFVLGTRLRRPVVLPFLVLLAAAGSTALMWMLYTPGTDSSRVFYGTDTRAAPLLVGVLLAFAWRPDSLPALQSGARRRALDVIGIGAFAAVAWAFAEVHTSDTSLYHGGFLLLAACAAVLLAAIVHPLSAVGRVLACRIPRWVGERSYGIYLWHWPVLVLMRPNLDVPPSRGFVLVPQVATTLLLAECSFRFVERPVRHGALRRLQIRIPRIAAQPRTPFVLAGLSVAVLAGLALLTPPQVQALPPGFTRVTLAQSSRAAARPVLPAAPRRHPQEPPKRVTTATRHARAARGPAIPRSGTMLALGDSVLLGSSSALDAALGPDLHVDAVVSRQVDDTIARLLAYRAEGSLPQRVIVHVGDNGPVYWADWVRLKQALAGVPLVVLVNVRVDRSWQDEVDDEMRQAVDGWRHATIADWYDASAAPGTLVDGVHTSSAGARAFAAVIARAIHSPNLGGVTH